MDIFPSEVYAHLFTIVNKVEYQALACVCVHINNIARNVLPLLLLNSNSTTCTIHDCHLTAYQTYVLRKLMSVKDSGTTNYKIPDFYNLGLIALAYASITGAPICCYITEKYPRLLESINFVNSKPEDYGTIEIGNVTLELGMDYSQSYATQQRYPVWVSSCIHKSFPEGKVLFLTGYKKDTEDHVSQLTPVEDYLEYDTFVVQDIRFAYSIFSTLTQFRSTRPKILIVNTYDDLAGYIPLPINHINTALEELQCIKPTVTKPRAIWYTPPNLTLAKLFALEYFTCYSGNKEQLNSIQSILDIWICDSSIEVITDPEMALLVYDNNIPGLVTTTTNERGNGKWVLIDPQVNIHTPLQVLNNM